MKEYIADFIQWFGLFLVLLLLITIFRTFIAESKPEWGTQEATLHQGVT